MTRFDSRRGVTLLELLIATTLLGVIAYAMYSSMSWFGKRSMKGARRVEGQKAVDNFLKEIVEAFRTRADAFPDDIVKSTAGPPRETHTIAAPGLTPPVGASPCFGLEIWRHGRKSPSGATFEEWLNYTTVCRPLAAGERRAAVDPHPYVNCGPNQIAKIRFQWTHQLTSVPPPVLGFGAFPTVFLPSSNPPMPPVPMPGLTQLGGLEGPAAAICVRVNNPGAGTDPGELILSVGYVVGEGKDAVASNANITVPIREKSAGIEYLPTK